VASLEPRLLPPALKREDEAKPLLVGLVRSRERDAILILLAAYLLDTFSRRDEEAASEIARVRPP
jgi:hypothetical protein